MPIRPGIAPWRGPGKRHVGCRPGRSTPAAHNTTAWSCAGVALGLALCTASLSISRAVSGVAQSETAVAGSVAVSRSALGVAQSETVAAGGVAVARALAGAAASPAIDGGSVAVKRALVGSALSISELFADVADARHPHGSALGVSQATGCVGVSRTLSGRSLGPTQGAGRCVARYDCQSVALAPSQNTGTARVAVNVFCVGCALATPQCYGAPPRSVADLDIYIGPLAAILATERSLVTITLGATMADYTINRRVRLSAQYRDINGVPFDPSSYALYVQPPPSALGPPVKTPIALAYDGVGSYHADVLLNLPGLWTYRWESTQSGVEAAEERTVLVKPSIMTST